MGDLSDPLVAVADSLRDLVDDPLVRKQIAALMWEVVPTVQAAFSTAADVADDAPERGWVNPSAVRAAVQTMDMLDLVDDALARHASGGTAMGRGATS